MNTKLPILKEDIEIMVNSNIEKKLKVNSIALLGMVLTIVGLAISVGVWKGQAQEILKLIPQHEMRLDTLEQFRAETSSNRFTSKDGLEVWKAIGEIKQNIAAIDVKLSTERAPAVWMVERIDRLENQINLRLDKIEGKLSIP